jgi:hypothetical protein
MDDRLKSLCARDGLFMTHEALAVGYDERTIARMVRTGEWHRVRHGAYTSAQTWAALDDRGRRHLACLAVLRSGRSHALLSHTSAAEYLGAPVLTPPTDVHITRTDGRAGRRAAGVAQHRGVVNVEDVTLRNGLPLTSGTRTALDVTTIENTERSLVIVNGLFHLGESSPALARRRLETIQHWPNTLHTDLVLRLADGRCASAGESRSYFLCWAQGLPMPDLQVPIRNREGRIIAWVDFAWPKLGAFMEFDGLVKYRRLVKPGESPSDVVIREKRREELICGLTGWRAIRIIWVDLDHPVTTADRIRAVHAGRPWAA